MCHASGPLRADQCDWDQSIKILVFDGAQRSGPLYDCAALVWFSPNSLNNISIMVMIATRKY